MTPLFCANLLVGVMVIKPAATLIRPSVSNPPWIRDSYTSPSNGIRETSHDAVMSPIASVAIMTNTAINGNRRGPYMLRGKV
jgi:hypothetical protein